MYSKYKANEKISYYVEQDSTTYTTSHFPLGNTPYRYGSYSLNSSTGVVTLSSRKECNSKVGTITYFATSGVGTGIPESTTATKVFYKFYYTGNTGGYLFHYNYWTMYIKEKITYSRGDLDSKVIALDGTYTIGSSTAVHKDHYWYERNSLAPRYTLYKYDSDLNLKSTYDVDTKTLTTESIDISNKGKNKVKLKLSTAGSNYKTYISNDNSTWQEVTGISSGTLKELDVDGWEKLYIKIETNTSRIDNIDVAYYKD